MVATSLKRLTLNDFHEFKATLCHTKISSLSILLSGEKNGHSILVLILFLINFMCLCEYLHTYITRQELELQVGMRYHFGTRN